MTSADILMQIIGQFATYKRRGQSTNFIFDRMALGSPRPSIHEIEEALRLGLKRGELRAGNGWFYLPQPRPSWGVK